MRAAHPACKTEKATRRWHGGHSLLRAPSRRSSQRIMSKPVESMCKHSTSFNKMRTQMPRMLLVPSVNVVRKCLLCLANKTTHDHHRMCLWPKVRIRASQICVLVPRINGVLGPRAPSSKRTFRRSDEPTGECEKEMQCVIFEWGTMMPVPNHGRSDSFKKV